MDAFLSEPLIADSQWGRLEKRFFRDDYVMKLGCQIRQQRAPLEPQQTHAPGLLPGQHRLDDGWFE